MRMIKKILVPTDFSELSFAGIEYVSSLSGLYNATVYLIHVLETGSVRTQDGVSIDPDAKVMELLSEVAAERMPHVRSVVRVVRHGEASREIVKFVREEGIDLVVIATHGRTGLPYVFMGSVAERVVRFSPVPVLAVKPDSVRMKFLEQADLDEQLHLRS